MDILPGEPAPPGFEDEVNRIAYIQQRIDEYKANALLGIEYTIELHADDDREVGYQCTLCEKRCDSKSIIHHWSSYNHRLKYLEKHFPTLTRELNTYNHRQNSVHKLIPVMQSVAEAIEDHHGRMEPMVCNLNDYQKMKVKINNKISNKYHHNEKNGPNFLDIVKRETARLNLKPAPKRGNDQKPDNYKRDLDEISSEEDIIDAKKPKKNDNTQYVRNPKFRRSSNLDEQRNTDEKQSSKTKEKSSKWNEYRTLLDIEIKRLKKLQMKYDQNPEAHPCYSDEWIQFWNKRYKELQNEKKINPNNHNFKPEWIIFWERRMKELFDDEIDKKKKEIKLKLNLPEDEDDLSDQYGKDYIPSIRKNNRNKGRNSPTDVIDISDDENETGNGSGSIARSSSLSRSISISPVPRRPRHERNSFRETEVSYKSKGRSKSRSISPRPESFERSRRNHHFPTSRNYSGRERDYFTETGGSYGRYNSGPYSRTSHYRVMDRHHIPSYEGSMSPGKMAIDDEPEDTGPLTVVAVLRLLTALEEHLGSLGPKVVDLLGKALALEKIKANSSEDLLLNEDNCVFFETIKEKLKGLLIARVIEDTLKLKAVKKTVKNIAAIIHQANNRGPEMKDSINEKFVSKHSSKYHQSSNASVKDLPFDRQLIATKLAASLVNAGRDDVSTEDMDKLIFFFILMVKLSKENQVSHGGERLHMKDVCYELGLPKPDGAGSFEKVAKHHNSSSVADEENSSERDSKDNAAANMLDPLTDSDLQTLLQNFKQLSSEEQHHLIVHLKKLESVDPTRVEKLRKFVNLANLNSNSNNNGSPNSYEGDCRSGSRKRISNFDDNDNGHGKDKDEDDDEITQNSEQRVNRKSMNNFNANKFSLDDDDDDEDDDYNFEEAFKAASRKVLNEEKNNEDAGPSRIDNLTAASSTKTIAANFAANLTSDTQNLIANLMGSIKQNSSKQLNETNSPISVLPPQNQANHNIPILGTHQSNPLPPQTMPPMQHNGPNYNSQMPSANPNMMPPFAFQGPPPPPNNYNNNYNPLVPPQPNMYFNNPPNYPPQWNPNQQQPQQQMPYNMPYNQMGYGNYGGN